MKKITLIRHAKSSWKIPDLADYERPLNGRGLRDLPLMGARLAQRGFKAQRMISSSARRALETAEQLLKASRRPPDCLIVEPSLYLMDARDLITMVQRLDSCWSWVAFVGHNPGMTEAANILSGKRIDNIPTCGVVEMHFPVDNWETVVDTEPIFFSFDFPKNNIP